MKKDAKQIIEKHFYKLLVDYKTKKENGENADDTHKILMELNDISHDIKLRDKNTPKEFDDVFYYWIRKREEGMTWEEQIAAGFIKVVEIRL